jgi:glucose/arabinose dehydrogenase
VELVAGGLQLPGAIGVGSDGELYVVETQAGLIRVIDRDGHVAAQPFLDLADHVATDGERGLLGLAFHPDYESNGRLFVQYTRVADGAVIVAEFSRSADGEFLDPASERVLLSVPHPTAYHNGGQLAFGPDGYLYVGIGDGGSLGDSPSNAQDPSVLLGKVLRIDVDAPADQGMGYAIPPDNPFADGGGAPEVYLVGLRNPWRFSFDVEADALWVVDVGEGAYEEVTRLDLARAAGANLGWPITEGSRCFNLLPCDTSPFATPLAEYSRDIGCAIIGGFVDRGLAIPGLAGSYLFADYCSGAILGIAADAHPATGEVLTPRVLLETGLQISTLGLGPNGEVYLADYAGGAIYRLVATGSS